MSERRYIPILKGKMGELNALARMGPDELAGAHPLVEVIGGSTTDEKPREEMLAAAVKRIVNAWSGGRSASRSRCR